jgi:hypothetical protein
LIRRGDKKGQKSVRGGIRRFRWGVRREGDLEAGEGVRSAEGAGSQEEVLDVIVAVWRLPVYLHYFSLPHAEFTILKYRL